MPTSLEVVVWKRNALLATIIVSWALVAASPRLDAALQFSGDFGVLSISAALMVSLCMATHGGIWKPWRRVLFVPACFLLHVVATVPTAGALGVLMKMEDRVRTEPEQKAVFILAALPVVIYAMRQSKLFLDRVEANPRVASR